MASPSSRRCTSLLALPWHAYTVPFSSLRLGVAHVFGAPLHSAPLFDRTREDFWSTRLTSNNPKADKMKWQAWLEYKHEEVVRAGVVPPRRGRHRADPPPPLEPEPEPPGPSD